MLAVLLRRTTVLKLNYEKINLFDLRHFIVLDIHIIYTHIYTYIMLLIVSKCSHICRCPHYCSSEFSATTVHLIVLCYKCGFLKQLPIFLWFEVD